MIFDFTWVMINIPVMASHEQITQLGPIFNLLQEIFFIDNSASHILPAIRNFVSKEPSVLKWLLESNFLERVTFKLKEYESFDKEDL